MKYCLNFNEDCENKSERYNESIRHSRWTYIEDVRDYIRLRIYNHHLNMQKTCHNDKTQ